MGKESYVANVQKYINKLSNKISKYAELVDAYNKNKFFENMDILQFRPIDWEFDDIPEEIIMDELDERKNFLLRIGITDICKENQDYYYLDDSNKK